MAQYGSADAAEKWTAPKPAPAVPAPKGMSADAAERWAANERARRAARLRVGRSGSQTRPLYDPQASSRKPSAPKRRAGGPSPFNKRGPLKYVRKGDDAVSFIAKKYGIDEKWLHANPEYKERYGIAIPRVLGDDKKFHTEGQDRSVLAFGKEGVYVGSYKEVMHQGMGDEKAVNRDLIITKKQAEGMIYGWHPDKVKAFQKRNKLKQTGLVDKKTWSRWSEGVMQAGQYYSHTGARIDPDTYLTLKYGSAGGSGGGSGRGGRRRGRGGGSGGGGGGGGGGGATQTRVTLTNRTELQRVLDQMFEDRLGRKSTQTELSRFLSEVNRQERANPQVATSNFDGTKTTVTGGIDPVTVAENFMISTMGGDVGTRLAGVDYFAAAMGLIGGN